MRSPPPKPVQSPAMLPVRETPLEPPILNPFRVLDCWPLAREGSQIPPGVTNANTAQAQSQVLIKTRARNRNREMKTRILLPKGRKRKRGSPHPKINLGKMFRDSRKLNKNTIDSTLWNFKQRLKLKSDNTFAMILQLSSLLTGTVFRSSYVYHATLPYIGWLPGYVYVRCKPNLSATRLLIEQVLHCRSNAPLGRILEVINSRG